MGQGHHWRAVLKNVRQDLGPALELGVTRCGVIGKRRIPNWHGPQGVRPADITLIQNSKAGVGALSLIVSDKLSSQTYVHSAFPIGTHGPACRVKVVNMSDRASVWKPASSPASATQRSGSLNLNYALDRDLYSAEAQLKVAISGIAYHVEIPAPKETVIHPEIGEVHLRGAATLLRLDGPGGTMLDMNGFGVAYMLAASEGPGPGDYRFRGSPRVAEPP